MIDARHAGKLRAVLDTNVYFAAFKSLRGVPHELWRRAVRQEYTLVVSPAIIRELADVLRNDLDWPEPSIVAQLKFIAHVATIIHPKCALQVIAADPDDDRIIECAVAGKADLIVSYDRHLTDVKAFQGIGIVRPVDFLRALGR